MSQRDKTEPAPNSPNYQEGRMKIIKHIKLVMKHKWIVFKLCCKIGMPYKYAAEMVCDELAAGMVYNGKNWTQHTQLDYYINKERKNLIHPQIDKFLIAIFTEVSQNGLDATLTKQNIKKLYEKYCIRMENLDENQI